MDYFGDESGHLKGVLQGDCEVCVLGIIAGDPLDCQRCAKKIVRDVEDIDEAKWNDLSAIQKRRMFECLSEQNISFGYAKITRDNLHSIDHCYYMHDDVTIPPDWDIALAGYAYGDILFEMEAPADRNTSFTFDRIASNKQSKDLAEHAKSFVSDMGCRIAGSKSNPAVQAADCFAGGVAEDHRNNTTWMSYLDSENIVECSYAALSHLENDLSKV